MKKLILVLFLLAVTVGGYSMIETLSLDQLAFNSDQVVFGTVVGVKVTGKTPEGVKVVANLIEVTEVLKGELIVGGKVKIKTFSGVEDNVAFVPGQKYLLFLQKAEGFYSVTNFVQGAWQLEKDGKFLGMGTGKSLESVKNAIKSKPLKFQPNVPDLQL